MTPSVSPSAPAPAAGSPAPARRGRGLPAALYELSKPGITRMVLVTAAAGFYLASRDGFDLVRFAHALIGTALVAAGSGALNQLHERAADATMTRTRHRPLPSGRVSPVTAGVFAVTVAAAGVGYLAWRVNVLTAVLAFLTVFSYVYLYTPLKRLTTLNTLVGAVPGALPILGGWTAAGAPVDATAWALFWILFVWQLPHFLALAWMYRDDYRRAGFAMLSVRDETGRATSRMALLYAAALVPLSLVPTLRGLTGTVYFFGALVLGALYAGAAVAFTREASRRRAGRLFGASILYLPLLFTLMVLDRLPH